MTVRIVRAATLAALVLTAACATAPGTETTPTVQQAPAAGASAAGTYTFTSEARGQSFEGTIRLARNAAGAYTGTVTTPLTGSLQVRSVDAQGSRIRVTAQGQMGDAVMNMVMNGAEFTGTWAYGSATGQMTGRMRPAS